MSHEALYAAIAQAGSTKPNLSEMADVVLRQRIAIENSMIAAHCAYGSPFDQQRARDVVVLQALERTLETFTASEGEIRAVVRRAANRRAA